MNKREFVQVLGAASAAGMGLGRYADADAATAQQGLYDIAPFGNVSFLHMTDCHAQLKPIHFREPSVNLGVGDMRGRLPHLVGEALLKAAGLRPGSAQAFAFTCLDFEKAARRYGRVGGFAHLATLVKQLKASRPGALLLDGGDTWQGSATALWTNAQDMVEAGKLLGVDIMTGHWEFTYGMERVKEIVEKDFKGQIEFLAQNVKTTDFGDPVFKPYVLREINGVPCAVIGQAFPYTPIANPRYLVADWSFGIQDDNMQKVVDEVRAKGAQVVVLLSHNGMDVDLKMATPRARHRRHLRRPHPRRRAGGRAGGEWRNHGRRQDPGHQRRQQRQVPRPDGLRRQGRQGGGLSLPAAADIRQPAAGRRGDECADRQGARTVRGQAWPSKLAVTDGLLYRRGNFNGSWDQLICDALMEVQGAEIAFSPGFRWGTTLLPGDTITRELMMDQLAITYPYATLSEHERRDDQDDSRRCCRQPVQPRSVLPAGRRHGARRRPGLHLRPDGQDGQSHRSTCASAARRSKPTRLTRWPAGRRSPKRPARRRATSRYGTWSRAG